MRRCVAVGATVLGRAALRPPVLARVVPVRLQSTASLCPSVRLNTGAEMPVVGLGTWKSKPGEVKAAVLAAIDAGYRHIDCAHVYCNEQEVGEALNERIGSAIKREDIFITSKLWNTFHRPADVEPACRTTLGALGLGYVDLYLVHWPVAFAKDPADPSALVPKDSSGEVVFETVPLEDTWKGMEGLVDKGLAKAIGLSNFNCAQTERIVNAARIIPAVNQVEAHVLLTQNKLLALLRKHGISMTAYSPFGSGDPRLLTDARVKAIGDKYGKSVPQVLLRFHVQRNVVVVPKSVTAARIRSNFDIFDFELSGEDMRALEGLNEGLRTCVPGWHRHPEFPFVQE